MVSCRLSATGIRFSGHPVPARGAGPSSRSAYHPPKRADPVGVSTFHTHESRPGWVPSLPRGPAVLSWPNAVPDQRLPHHNGLSLHPAHASHRAEFRFTRHQRGFTQFTRPVCPSPVAPSRGRGLLRLSPRASHPTVTSSARQGRGQAASTRPGLHHRHHAGPPNCESTRKVRHRVATANPEEVRSPRLRPSADDLPWSHRWRINSRDR